MNREDALKQHCPRCRAVPGEPCVGRRGPRISMHINRFPTTFKPYLRFNKGVRANRCNVLGRVYFIGPQGASLIKIGWTQSDPQRRLKELQTGNGERFHLFGSIAGTRRDEQALHKKFKALHAHGEWFNGVGDLRALVIEVMDA